jgi:crossover junction endodeoxyribonuclease RuvC
MIILSLDISSTSTGWAVLETGTTDKLVEYGLIKPDGMDVIRRLYFFGNEIKKLIEKYKPNEICIEEVVLVRGPVIMRTLASFRGVALFQAYSYQKKDITTFEPPSWKKIIGLGGFAKKCEIQLYICEYFKLMNDEKISEYKIIIKDLLVKLNDAKKGGRQRNSLIAKQMIDEKQKLESSDLGKNDIKKQLKLIEKKLAKETKNAIKEIEKKIDNTSIDIYADCGVNSDVADAIGVGLAFIKKIK